MYSGKQTVLTLSSGLKIGVLGGQFSLDHFVLPSLPSPEDPYYTSSSLDAFSAAPSTSNIDILLSHTWPSQVSRYSEKPLSETFSKQDVERWGVPAIQQVMTRAKPRYCFVGNQNLFWEREPFVYPQSSSSSSFVREAVTPSATRFLSIGHFNNPTKQRWFYAFTITPASHQSQAQSSADVPPNVTACPFELAVTQQQKIRGTKRPYPESDEATAVEEGSYIFGGTHGSVENGRIKKHGEPPQTYKCKICGIPGHFIQVWQGALGGICKVMLKQKAMVGLPGKN